jgi:hypothetical protein
MLITQKLRHQNYKLLLLNAGAFVAATAFPAHGQIIGEATKSSDKYVKDITGNANLGAGSFDLNKAIWGLIGFMLIVFIAGAIWFATADGMGGQQTWKDNLFKILGVAAPIVISIIVGASVIKWVGG